MGGVNAGTSGRGGRRRSCLASYQVPGASIKRPSRRYHDRHEDGGHDQRLAETCIGQHRAPIGQPDEMQRTQQVPPVQAEPEHHQDGQQQKSDDAEQISAKTQTLIQASMKLGEAMYKAQQEGGATEGETGSDDDHVVDAEFEEVDDDKKSA